MTPKRAAKLSFEAYSDTHTPEDGERVTKLNRGGTAVTITTTGNLEDDFIGSMTFAFRGIEPTDLRDWKNDLDYKMMPTTLGQAHRGFLNALAPVSIELSDELNHISTDTPVYCTGHSLGGALATLWGANLLSWGYNVRSITTFGSPRVFDAKAKERVYRLANGTTNCRILRYVNCADIVTRLPSAFQGYRHVGRLCYFNRHGKLSYNPPAYEMWWDRLCRRVGDIGKPGTTGIKDHRMSSYLSLVNNS